VKCTLSPGAPGTGTSGGGGAPGVPGAASQPVMVARAVRCAPLVPPTLPWALFSGLRVAAAVNCGREEGGHSAAQHSTAGQCHTHACFCHVFQHTRQVLLDKVLSVKMTRHHRAFVAHVLFFISTQAAACVTADKATKSRSDRRLTGVSSQQSQHNSPHSPHMPAVTAGRRGLSSHMQNCWLCTVAHQNPKPLNPIKPKLTA
jgi:hypothetical protein